MIIFICKDENIGSEELIFRCLKKYAEIKGVFYEPEKVKIARNKNGKPYFENLGVSFSLSHTIGLKIVAMSSYNVGADAELIRPIECREKIAERFFTRSEHIKIRTARDFFSTWAAKEAYSKYTSFGISSFKKFDVHKLNDVFVKKLDVGRKYAAYCVSIDGEIEYCEIN
jgi:phosphopantetheine--protein transferase-like protein